MDDKGEPQDGATGVKYEELPQMDGSCDVCEPDEAQPATHVCHACSFAFCPIHTETHASRMHHPLMPYNHEGTQVNGLGTKTECRVGGEAEDEALAPSGGAVANGGERSDEEGKEGVQNDLPLGVGAEGAEEGEEAVVAGDTGRRRRRRSVTVERLRCKEHGQEGSLYCKEDEKIICVLCAVQGEHKDHTILTLHEAYLWQKGRQGYDLLGCTQQMAEKINTKWINPVMSIDELENYVDAQFDELRKLVRLAEKRTLHLVDLKEAFLTASAAEKIAEINVETEQLQEEMASINHELFLLEQAEAEGASPAVIAAALAPPRRVMPDVVARPRFPEPRAAPLDPRDFEDDDSGPSMGHAP
ncbi:tripartite motif-containing protein 44 isoform X2 [Platichthys flesus]|nr:tripartite motif-containing protein 44 isoform X2 [Platichthys flesus]XP_062245468.1 tripartite motif-containing protein 44 isoform X2 [Platichthys flesus]